MHGEPCASAKWQRVEGRVGGDKAFYEEDIEGLSVQKNPQKGIPLQPLNDIQGDQKAAKHDDAEVPTHLWNERAREGSRLKLSDRQLDCVCVCALRYWKRLIAKGF